MPKRIFSGGSSGRRGFPGGFASGGYYVVDFLGTVPDQPSMLLLTGDKGDWCIRSDTNTVFIIIAEPPSLIGNWQQLAYPLPDVHDFGGVLHNADTIANIQTKISDGSIFTTAPDEFASILEKSLPVTDDKTLLEDSAAAGAKKYITLESILGITAYIKPVISIFDNTLALPVLPNKGDRYIALVTANGWTKDHDYTYQGLGVWFNRYPPIKGLLCFDTDLDTYCLYNGTDWFPLLRMDKIVQDDSGYVTVNQAGDTVVLGFNDHGFYTVYQYWLNPVLSIFDNTLALPALPNVSDRYIAKVTAHGWTKDNIYEWNNVSWLEFFPSIGAAVKDISLKVNWHYDGTNWLREQPPAHAASHQGGTDALAVDAAAGTGSFRTIGTGALQACAGNDARLSDARTPTAHKSTHEGGTDALTVDAAAGTGSFRTIGTGALQAAAGNHTHTETRSKEKTFYNPSGITNAVNALVFQTPSAMTVVKIRARRVGGTACTINARKNGASNHLGSALSLVNADTWYSSTSINNASYAVDDWLEIMIVSVSGSPTQVQIQVDFQKAI
jgi:hypothetical protein